MSEFARGAKPLIAATLGNMCGALAITTYTQSFFVGPVTEEFGWSQGQFFLGFTIMSVLGIISAPLIGSLALKYGIRILGMIGLIGHALGYLFFSLNPNSLLLWYVTWGAFTFMIAGALPIIWTTVLNSWFIKNRGTAIGITMAGSGVVAFLLPPIVEILISNYGWRFAYRAVGIGALMISLPIVFLWFREKPIIDSAQAAEHGEAIDSSNNGSNNSSKIWGISRKEAMATLKFWNLAAVLLLTVFVVVGLLSNFGPILGAKGVERETIAILAAVMGVCIIIGRLLVGFLVDKFWAPAVASVIFGALIIAMILLMQVPFSMPLGIAVAVAVGMAAGSELDLLAFLTSKYFGPKHYSAIFGAIFAIFGVGAGAGPAVFGELASRTGDYTASLYVGIACLIIAIPLFLSLGRYPDDAIKELN